MSKKNETEGELTNNTKEHLESISVYSKWVILGLFGGGLALVFIVITTMMLDSSRLINHLDTFLGFSLLLGNGGMFVYLAWRLHNSRKVYLNFKQQPDSRKHAEWWASHYTFWLSLFGLLAMVTGFIIFILFIA